jgi:hypothetical protein
MAESSAAAASTAAVPGEVTVSLRIAGRGSAAQFEGPTNVGLFLNAVVDAKPGLFRDFLRAYRVPCTREKLAIAETAKSEADAERAGELLLPRVDAIAAGDYILVVLLQQAAPSSTTGKCPHSIVFPSVARSSLTWSLCFMCPLCGCRCRGRTERQRGRRGLQQRGSAIACPATPLLVCAVG